jgi:hypothetical protein
MHLLRPGRRLLVLASQEPGLAHPGQAGGCWCGSGEDTCPKPSSGQAAGLLVWLRPGYLCQPLLRRGRKVAGMAQARKRLAAHMDRMANSATNTPALLMGCWRGQAVHGA